MTMRHRQSADHTRAMSVWCTGDLESGPVLVHTSGDECVYQFEWYTAAACPMSHQHGKDCTVVDTQAGQCQAGSSVCVCVCVCVFLADVTRERGSVWMGVGGGV